VGDEGFGERETGVAIQQVQGFLGGSAMKVAAIHVRHMYGRIRQENIFKGSNGKKRAKREGLPGGVEDHFLVSSLEKYHETVRWKEGRSPGKSVVNRRLTLSVIIRKEQSRIKY